MVQAAKVTTRVEVVYMPESGALFHKEVLYKAGMTVEEALKLSHLYEIYPDAQAREVGIFSELVDAMHLVKPGDRLEVYRELVTSPKEKRRNRAKG